jgi:hypothetical protein
MARDIYGETPEGEFGLRYQLEKLNAYGLRAVFFVDSLCADALGVELLREIVTTIMNAGHEVQLHLHTEWLSTSLHPVLGDKTGTNMSEFTAYEQARLVARGLENLRACGVSEISACRAGNYGANLDTLRALAENGVRYDTSYNVAYLDSVCEMRMAQLLNQPTAISGIYEFPISFFRDWLGHYRPVQLTACSAGELKSAMFDAWHRGWYSFVIVSHSFELLQGRLRHRGLAVADRFVIDRFEALCHVLASNRDKFNTAVFADVDPAEIPAAGNSDPLSSPLSRTAWRYGEQLARRIL